MDGQGVRKFLANKHYRYTVYCCTVNLSGFVTVTTAVIEIEILLAYFHLVTTRV